MAHEVRVRPQGRGAADIPEGSAVPSAVDETDITAWRGDERRGRLEYKDGVGIALSVKRESACYLESAVGRIIDTCRQCSTTELSGNLGDGRSAGGIVVGGYQGVLGLACFGISQVYGPAQRHLRLPGKRGSRIQSHVTASVSVDCGWSSIGDS